MIGYDIIHGGIVEGFWVGPILEDCTTWSYGNDTTVFSNTEKQSPHKSSIVLQY